MWALVCLWLSVTLVWAQKVDLREVCKKYGESAGKDGDSCATSSRSYVGLKDASPREFPHMAQLGYGDESDIKWFCGGSLISERFILGAAHCVDPGPTVGPPKWVRLGAFNIDSTVDEAKGQLQSAMYEIAEATAHPDYSTEPQENDIALFKLKKDVEFNKYMRPACVHSEHQLPETFAQTTGWAVPKEWGAPGRILQKLNMSIIPNKECNDAYKDIRATEGFDIIDDSMICGKSENKDELCQGSGGGPLQVVLKEPPCMYSIVGITSFGASCGSGLPMVYTRVSRFFPWIQNIVWS